MGNSGQVIVFVFFGQKYLDQFWLCAETIPEHWQVKVITDIFFAHPLFDCIEVPTPATVYDMLTFRKDIDKFININQYDQVWYSDPDMLFTGDILAKYKNCKKILVSQESWNNMQHPCMNGGFTPDELHRLLSWQAPAINGGLYMVSKCQYDFFVKYRDVMNWFISLDPMNRANDQFAINNLFHRAMCDFQLFDYGDICFHGHDGTGLVNHFIAYSPDEKIGIMKNELKKLKHGN